ncbi:hypothetical protein Leryth_021098 [Lithospermum erythrorhizon]|nr:hypothetical protein Leryth_021098 [Lithospermum erythrorhizon]
MPPPPQPHSSTTTTTTFMLFILFTIFSTTLTNAHHCSRPPNTTTIQGPCAPFTSRILPFPFSLSPGCGHPSFQIQCSNLHNAIISINNISFSLLHYEPNTTSLTLSPIKPQNSHHNCNSLHNLYIPNKIISFSNSPFTPSDSSCSRLAALKPCLPPNLPNCSHCSFECKLIKNPVHLINECGTTHHQDSQQGCQSDILGYLDNLLQLGIEVEWDEEKDAFFTSCKACKSNNGFCGFNITDHAKPFICFPFEKNEQTPLVKEQSPNRVALLSILALFLVFLVFVSIATLVMRSRNNKSLASEEDPAIVYLRRHRSASLLPPVFSYEELEAATNRFDLKRKIGDGGFGSVYLGQLLDGRIVAVKHLHKHNNNNVGGDGKMEAFSTKSFCNEILILSSITHPNLVKLHGYCSDPRGLLLVYDYVPNGTLSDHLHGTKNFSKRGALTWNFRVDIALQISLAMEYLHFSVFPPIVHRDITSSNIFIEKDMRVKVGDFGLSRLLICTEATMVPSDSSGGVWTGPQGTPGYLDPDYYKSFRLNEKSDIYSFGVVLLELITGMRAVDQKREKREVALADMVVSRIQLGLLHQVLDPVLVVSGEAMEDIGSVAELAFRCVATDKDDRPDAREVVVELRRIKGCGRGVGGGAMMLRMSNSSNVVVPDDVGGGGDGGVMLRVSNSSSVVVPDGVGLIV